MTSFIVGGTSALPMLYHEQSARIAPHGFFGKPAAGVFGATSDRNHVGDFFAPDGIAVHYRESGHSTYGDNFPTIAAHNRQVHGNDVISIPEQEGSIIPTGRSPDDHADGLVTTRHGLALTVKTADCLPGLLYSENGKAIGSFHAGWKGACKGIVENTVAALHTLSNHPERAYAIIGPCIRTPSFEVKNDFIDEAGRLGVDTPRYITETVCDDGRTARYVFDLPALVRDRLNAAGIVDECIFDSGIDTCPIGSGYFSFRRNTQEKTAYLYHNYAWICRPAS